MEEQKKMTAVDVEEEYSKPTPIRDALAGISPLQMVLLVIVMVYGASNVSLSAGLAGLIGGAIGVGGPVLILMVIYNR